MAAAATTLLALCALLAGAGADHDHCTRVTTGEVTDWAAPQKHVHLTPYILNWDIYFSSDQACDLPHGIAVGLKVKVCDHDGPPPPVVMLPSLRHAFITRRTAARSTGIVYSTVYCRSTNADTQPRVVAQVGGSQEVGEPAAGSVPMAAPAAAVARILARARYAAPYG